MFNEVLTADSRSKAALCKNVSSQLIFIMAIFSRVADAFDNLEALSKEGAIPLLARPLAARIA